MNILDVIILIVTIKHNISLLYQLIVIGIKIVMDSLGFLIRLGVSLPELDAQLYAMIVKIIMDGAMMVIFMLKHQKIITTIGENIEARYQDLDQKLVMMK